MGEVGDTGAGGAGAGSGGEDEGTGGASFFFVANSRRSWLCLAQKRRFGPPNTIVHPGYEHRRGDKGTAITTPEKVNNMTLTSIKENGE